MTFIRSKQFFPCHQPLPKQALLLAGFGGSIWQLRRLVRVLNKAGYDVTALDFPKSVLSSGDTTHLPQLVDEVVAFAEKQARASAEPTLLVGVSLGALFTLNILRRSNLFDEGVLITGGDIAKIAQKLYPSKWPQPYAQLAKAWQDINMYTLPAQLKNKRLLFVVHPSSKLIDVRDIRREAKMQQAAGNHLVLVERDRFDHIGTIIEETILRPKRVLTYIDQVKKP
ncbi:MAG TPA: alpha/beta hydrolase [Candidatus Saccharimonadales bacterium]|nr:alpha/beta hydrolase [Candidatus Saccharimonadales bacterium]